MKGEDPIKGRTGGGSKPKVPDPAAKARGKAKYVKTTQAVARKQGITYQAAKKLRKSIRKSNQGTE